MQSLSSRDSATTQEQTGALTPTGTLPGGTGAIALTKQAIQTAIASGDSDQVRREVGALLEQCVPSLRRMVSADYELTGYKATTPLTDEQRNQLRALSRYLTKPSERAFVSQEVTRCLSLTKSRAQDEADIALTLAAMTEELVKYPADLVAWSLRKWSIKETFWPSLAEILAPIKREMGWRNSLETAAGTVIKTEPQAQRSSWHSLPQDRKDRVNEALKRAGISEPMP